MNLGEIKKQVLRLLGLTVNTAALDDIPFWTVAGLEDAFAIARPAWAIRAATVDISSDGVLRTPPSYIAFKSIFPVLGGPPLQFVTPDQGGPMLGLPWPGMASHVMMEGDLVTILPFPPEGEVFRTSYYSKLEPLVEDADTNLWTQRVPSMLIYAICRHGALQQENDDGVNRYNSAFMSAVDQCELQARKAQRGSGIVMTRTPVARTGYRT